MFDSRFGLLIPQRGARFGLDSLDRLLRLAVDAEDSGLFGSVWVGDSLTAQPRADSLSLLGALGAMTGRVRLGTACLASFSLRDPALLAYQWATLDQISNGRMVLGACTGLVSGGVSAREGAHWGVADRERAPRLEENIEICRRLWTGKPVDFDGRFHSYQGISVDPTPVQDPCPILIAANPWEPRFAERAMRRVATMADGWMTAGSWPGLFEALWGLLRDQLAEAGRDPDTFPVVAMHNINIGPDRDECLAETGRFIAVHENDDEVPAPMLEAWTAAGPPGRCAADLSGLLAKGAGHIVLRITSWDQRGQLRRLVEEVLPQVNG
ncbi:LLM class flavin-dependent oxidoreductase [Sphaerisporangium fuscum]|uniref:LLM class flavin-dependent oxidoreductase n=1 Tax=Sphaerisporangium fuscum TaxID=2835868 RepID=UPI001BDCAFEA|nr:LLM class flavin-dependent oxidoreductase [Sphaerisporangium fuscum]